MKKLSINPISCTGCLNCEVVCAQTRAGNQDRRASVIRVELDIFGGNHSHLFCRQCEDPLCVQACPEKAILKNEQTGAWIINRELCNRCGQCISACSFGAMMWWDEKHGPVKCDLCGGTPQCVAACHFDVIRYLEGSPQKALK